MQHTGLKTGVLEMKCAQLAFGRGSCASNFKISSHCWEKNSPLAHFSPVSRRPGYSILMYTQYTVVYCIIIHGSV